MLRYSFSKKSSQTGGVSMGKWTKKPSSAFVARPAALPSLGLPPPVPEKISHTASVTSVAYSLPNVQFATW